MFNFIENLVKNFVDVSTKDIIADTKEYKMYTTYIRNCGPICEKCSCNDQCNFCYKYSDEEIEDFNSSTLAKDIMSVYTFGKINQQIEETFIDGNFTTKQKIALCCCDKDFIIEDEDGNTVIDSEGDLNVEWKKMLFGEDKWDIECDKELSLEYQRLKREGLLKQAADILSEAEEEGLTIVDEDWNIIVDCGNILIPDYDDRRGYDVYTQITEFGGDYEDVID